MTDTNTPSFTITPKILTLVETIGVAIGRLWQTLILCTWKPVFAWLPVESIVKKRQKEYYNALRISDQAGNTTHFIELMLTIVLEAINSGLLSDQVTDQVKKLLCLLLNGESDAAALMKKLNLAHRPTFRKNYLHPALDAKLIEMTNPVSPNSPNQRYRITEKGTLLCNRK